MTSQILEGSGPLEYLPRVGIIGYGRAAQARIRALHALGVPIAMIASQRESHDVSPSDARRDPPIRWVRDWRALVHDPAVDLVLICSGTQHHDEQARVALRADKHVVVEFPLTTSAQRAIELWSIAEERGLLLHVEVIGSLTSHHHWSQGLAQRAAINQWHSRFTGKLYRWVEETARAELIPLLAFGRLYQAVDLFGDLTVTSAQLKRSFQREGGELSSYLLEVELESVYHSVSLSLSDSRSLNTSRSSQVSLFNQQGDELSPPSSSSILGSSRPLFERDTLYVLCLLNSTSIPQDLQGYASQRSLLTAHRLCDMIAERLNA